MNSSTFIKITAILFLLIQVGLQWTSPQESISFYTDKEEAGMQLSAWMSEVSADTPETAIDLIMDALLNNPLDIYGLTVSDIQGTFTQDQWEEAYNTSPFSIESVELKEDIVITNDWAECVIDIAIESGDTYTFLVVLHKEDSVWRVFGTKEV